MPSSLPSLISQPLRQRQSSSDTLVRRGAYENSKEVGHWPTTDLTVSHPRQRGVLGRLHRVVESPPLKLAVPPHSMRAVERAFLIVVLQFDAPINNVGLMPSSGTRAERR